MITTPSMGLTRWDQPNDIFSYTDLSQNWAAIDSHDHTATKGVQIPTEGLVNLAVTTNKLANSAVTDAKLSTGLSGSKLSSASVDDSKLISPSLGVWRTVYNIAGQMPAGSVTSAGTYWIDGATGVLQRSATINTGIAPHFWYPNSLSDYAVSGKTTQVRQVTSILTNATAPGVTVSSAIYPSVAHSFTSNNVALTLGSAYSSASFGTPSTLVGLTGSGAAVILSSLPTNFYLVGVNFSGTPAAGSVIAFSSRIEMRHV